MTMKVMIWLLPKTRVVAAVAHRHSTIDDVDGDNTSERDAKNVITPISNLVVINDELQIGNMPGDIIGRHKNLTLILDDGRTIFVNKDGAFKASSLKKVCDAWEDLCLSHEIQSISEIMCIKDVGSISEIKDD